MYSFCRGVDRRCPAALALLCAVAAAPALGGFTVFSVGGNALPASIQPTVDSFRTALGNPNNENNPGPLAGGRREIDWDGGLHATSTSGGTLTEFRNTRGSALNTMGTFKQTRVDHFAFTEINPTYSTTFGAFSSPRIFTPVGSTIIDVSFYIPGTNGAAAATATGFGAVFSDVDMAATTRMEFFDLGGTSLGLFHVPAGTVPSASLSFLGAIANAGEQIAWVQIITGNSPLGPNDGGGVDVVVMDDFLYSEPIPEPGAALFGVAAVILARRGRCD